jgi:putative NIF3 family GTP cyclohydrolase 1 type 2
MTSVDIVVKYLEEIAPHRLSVGGLEGHIEIGPQTSAEQMKTTVNRILIGTYPSSRLVTKATQEKTNLIITQRPFFPFPIDRLTGLDLVRVRLLSKNYISSYVMGSAWVCANGGLTDALVDVLGLKKEREFMVPGDYIEAVPLGRICKAPSQMNHSKFTNVVTKALEVKELLFTGDLDKEVESVLVVPGPNVDIQEILLAQHNGVQTIVTGDLTREGRLLAHEEGINLLEIGGFATEEPGMKRLRHQMSLEFPEEKIEFFESAAPSKILSVS